MMFVLVVFFFAQKNCGVCEDVGGDTLVEVEEVGG
jgi:hypothetical protein